MNVASNKQTGLQKGTRFKVFCQYPYQAGFEQPEVIRVTPQAGSINSGPNDGRIHVVDAVAKAHPYSGWEFPPYPGSRHPPVPPDAAGHFDYIEPSAREFRAVHAYACLRRVLDIWENYLGHQIRWVLQEQFPSIEVIPDVDFVNAQASPGSIELGYGESDTGGRRYFALSFDVLAHEMGHIILGAEVGIPATLDNAEYFALQESMSDIISLISVLHFDTFIDHLLLATRGNLYAPNALNRLVELSPTNQIRSASHGITMLDIPFRALPRDRLNQPQLHLLGQPLTGALFDLLVEMFQRWLVEANGISQQLNKRSTQSGLQPADLAEIQKAFDGFYAAHPQLFREALIFARDATAERLVRSWEQLNPDRISLLSAAGAFLTADREISGDRYQALILKCVRWRKFGQ